MQKRLPLAYYATQPFYRFLAVAIFLLPAMGWSGWCLFQRSRVEAARTKKVAALFQEALKDNPVPDLLAVQRAINDLADARRAGASPEAMQARLAQVEKLIHEQFDPMAGAADRNQERAHKIELIARTAKADQDSGFMEYMIFPPNPKLAKQ